jgi:hypothetical protein
MEEEFRLIPDFPLYRVSNLGNVESCLSGTWKRRKLKRVSKGKGRGYRYYLGFNARIDNEELPSGRKRTKTLLVHKLVAELFIGPKPPDKVVLHKDDNVEHNHESNLEYGTQSTNVKQAYANGRIKFVRDDKGLFRGSVSTKRAPSP